MNVQPLKNEQVVPMANNPPVAQPTAHLAAQAPKVKAGQPTPHQEVLSGAVTAPAKEVATRLAAIHDDKSVRVVQAVALRTASTVNIQMEAIKEALTHIVKDYPPFAMGDEKRQQYLMSISGIRSQIEALMIPPNGFNHQALPNSLQTKETWNNLFQGVNLPELSASGPNEATNAQVFSALDSVGSLQAGLAVQRSALEQQTATNFSISPLLAQNISLTTGLGLSQTGLSMSTNLSGALKDF